MATCEDGKLLALDIGSAGLDSTSTQNRTGRKPPHAFNHKSL